MDLAKGTKFELNIPWQKMGWAAYIPGIWLIYHVVSLARVLNSQQLMADFQVYRNMIYLGFAIVFLILGVVIMLSRLVGKENKSGGISLLVSGAILGLILVTFAYAIAGVLMKMGI